MIRHVLHIDLDQFIAAVEILRRPELRGMPVVVGGDGDPTKRGVVMTASYEARRFGVGSAMPLRTAYRKLPEAVFLPADPDAYRAASAEVMAALRTFPVTLEVAGWDEAFLEAETSDPETLARDIQKAVLERTGLHCSVGIGDNKLRAKMATPFGKPGGVFRLTAANWHELFDGQPTSALWGIGRKIARRLDFLGIRTVAELATAEDDRLAREFGPNTGPWLRQLATGDVYFPVTPEPHVARGHGHPAGFTQIILASVPLLTFFFAVLHGQEAFGWRPLAGALIALAGIGVMFRAPVTAVPFLPFLAILGTAACVAESTVVARQFPKIHLATMNAVAMTTGAVLLLATSVVAGETRALPTSAVTWAAFGYLVLVGSVAIFALFLFILNRWTASATSYLFVLFPISAVALSAWLEGEPLSTTLLLGGALVVLGVYVGALATRPREPTAVTADR